MTVGVLVVGTQVDPFNPVKCCDIALSLTLIVDVANFSTVCLCKFFIIFLVTSRVRPIETDKIWLNSNSTLAAMVLFTSEVANVPPYLQRFKQMYS